MFYIIFYVLCIINIFILILLVRTSIVEKVYQQLLAKTDGYNLHTVRKLLNNFPAYERILFDFTCWRIKKTVNKYWIRTLQLMS